MTAWESVTFMIAALSVAFGVGWLVLDYRDWSVDRDHAKAQARAHAKAIHPASGGPGRGHLRLVVGDE